MRLNLINPCDDLGRTQEIWETLEQGHNESFFLSWGWMENWLMCLPKEARPLLAVIEEGDKPQLAFFLGKTEMGRKPLFPWRRAANLPGEGIYESLYGGRHLFSRRGWFLNSTGIGVLDRLHIEYNGFLTKNAVDLKLADILHLLPNEWDEFYLPGIEARPFLELTKEELPYETIIDYDTLSPFVDLEGIRAQGKDYLSFLSANTRAQIKKSYRLCEAPVTLEVARDLGQAFDIFQELLVLHEKVWSKDKGGGAFSADFLVDFHRRLIHKRFEHNEIQLLRIKRGRETLGCLYNFVYKKKVSFYQSGINYDRDERLRPGIISHVEAIGHNLAAGNDTYDFLGGSERYKLSLATHHNRLLWLRVQKPLLRFKIERKLKRIWRFLRKFTTR